MSSWLLLIPIISALFGWLFTRLAVSMLFHPQHPRKIIGVTIQGLLPKRRRELSLSVANMLSRELETSQTIEKSILDPAILQKLMPGIEAHIDHFLRVKLKDAIPMVAMFVGDKTIIQLKEVFMTEMQALFPEIMESYVKELKKGINIREIVTSKLDSVPMSKIEMLFLQLFHKELSYVQAFGALLGFVTGIFQVIITLFINH